ncbi:MAG: N-acetylmuramoyl-L-alanine amidase [Vicinamibacterales bacterium]
MFLHRPVLAAVFVAASGLLAAQAPAPLSPTDARPSSTLPPVANPVAGAGTAAPLGGLTVVLDPGHGGPDTGVRAGDRSEAVLVLAIARRVADRLTADGARVVLTRDLDVALDADTRAIRANQARAHLYLSLHLNRSPRIAASGAEVYTHLPQPAGEPAPAEALVRWDRVQDRYTATSDQIAALVAASLAARVPVSPAPLQRLPLRGLAGLDMPAVLVEMAYLSNAEQAALVETVAFQTAVADALAEALAAARRPEAAR